ncbi:MAG TPA: hypothetical protein VLJ21_02735 [Candidatus Binatia bacterium]|nr:hypothetical protein [Candidatus Binatia bacterium]
MPNHLPHAEQRLGVASHLLTRTYPMVKDSRILLAVAKELHTVATSTMLALLEHEKAEKRIPALVMDPASRVELLSDAIAHHKLDPKFQEAVQKLHEIVVEHEKSPIEFAKPDRFVICDKDYKLTTVTHDFLKTTLSTLRTFITEVQKVTHARVPV